jgi:Mg2+-importing ATPase
MMTKQEAASLTNADALTTLSAKIEGLSEKEVIKRQSQFSLNIFQIRKVSAIKVLLRQFNNIIIYLLLIACVIALAMRDLTDGIVIGVVLLTNALLGFTQEYRSEKTVEKLTNLVKHHVMVQREGKPLLVTKDQLVPGDIVILRQGDVVPADAKLLTADDLRANESQLTGESVAVDKKVELLVFAGSIIDHGEGTAVVYATGEETELGRISHLSSTTHRVTQYEQSLQSFSYLLLKITLLLVPLIFFIKIVVLGDHQNLGGTLVFMFAFAIAVVPEALPVIVTVSLATGASRLAKEHVVAKELSAIEDLGNITVLCTDKTGTITENEMKITQIVSDDPDRLQIFAYASAEGMDVKHKKFAGAFDAAFDQYLTPALKAQANEFKKLKELPFDPEDRRSRVVLEDKKTHKHFLVEMGSAETVLTISHSEHKTAYVKEIAADGLQGLRHIAIAYKETVYNEDFDIEKNEKELIFLGFAKLSDPLKPSAKHTIALAEQLGVAVKIITGDSPEVAGYVAREVGLLKEGEKVYTGDEIDTMTPEMVHKIVPKASVFARVNPEQKYAIIKVLKETAVVGYSGDGINDVPSLKLADVGIAVNTAADVAKDSADIILLRSDLGVLVAGIKNGRGIFVNINKYIRYTMIGNFSSFFTLGVLYLLGSTLPLEATQLLIVSSFTQIPLTTIATDTTEEEELAKPSHYNTRSLMLISVVLGLITTFCQLMFYAFVRGQSAAISQTSLFLYLTLLQLIVIFSIRNKTYFWKGKAPSWSLTWAMTGTFAVTMALVYVSPLREWFSLVPLSLYLLLINLGATAAYLVLIDLIKVWFYQIPEDELRMPATRLAK